MKYEITKEQILETIRTGTDVTKRYFKEIIPEAFNTKLDTGKWYKSSTDIEFLVCYQSSGFDNYGFWDDQPYRDNISFGDYWDNMSRLATDEEVSAALINEAKKRGFVEGVEFICLISGKKGKTECPGFLYEGAYGKNSNSLETSFAETSINGVLYKDGKWAEILPQEKTVVPMAKALKIIAKKMKVSPENIEIQY